jgi:competence protein ComEA
MNRWWSLVWPLSLGVLIGLLAGGVILLVSSPERGEPVSLLPPPTPSPLIVHVTGAVAQPGVYALPPGSRLQDAIRMAGGFLPEADNQALNLAAPIVDGALIRVPSRAQAASSSSPAASQEIPPPQTPAISATNPLININTATQQELESLPGIGPALALRIIEYRNTHGPFANIEAIQDVSGIGPGIFEKIRDYISIGP